MGAYHEYLTRNMNPLQMEAERKHQLQRISDIRNRAVLVYAADFNKAGEAPVSLGYSDLGPINDLVGDLTGDAVDVIIETPGGSGETAEDIVRLLHGKFQEVGFIIPGWAKSAGTIMAMAGDEILMGPSSALGPIDAQIGWQGKGFSAEALLEGLEKIKRSVDETGTLNRAYIPILQQLSPGELQHAENALNFATEIVGQWLAQYKFKNWTTHSSTGQPVTDEEKQARSKEIAGQLCNHRKWLTHGRSIKMSDLEQMGLRITDYSQNPDLNDAITRYFALLQHTFERTPIYKWFETPLAGIGRGIAVQVPLPPQGGMPIPMPPGGVGGGVPPQMSDSVVVNAQCNRCGGIWQVQANLGAPQPMKPGALPFPANNVVPCPQCGNQMDLTPARQQIESLSNKKIVT